MTNRYRRIKILGYGLAAVFILLVCAFGAGIVVARANQEPVKHTTSVVTVPGPTKTVTKKVPGPVTRELTPVCGRYIAKLGDMTKDYEQFVASYGPISGQIDTAMRAIGSSDRESLNAAQRKIADLQYNDKDSLETLANALPEVQTLKTECESSQ